MQQAQQGDADAATATAVPRRVAATTTTTTIAMSGGGNTTAAAARKTIPRAPRRQLLLEASTYTNVRGAVVDIPYFVYDTAATTSSHAHAHAHAHVDVRDARGHRVHARHLAEPVELQVESLTACMAQCLFVLWYAVLIAALVVEVVPSAQWSLVNVCGAAHATDLRRADRWSSDMCLSVTRAATTTTRAAAAAVVDDVYVVQWRGVDVAAIAATLNQFRRIAVSVASPLSATTTTTTRAQRNAQLAAAAGNEQRYHLRAEVALRHAMVDDASDGAVVSFSYPVTLRCRRGRARCDVALIPLDVSLQGGALVAVNVTLVDVPRVLAQALQPQGVSTTTTTTTATTTTTTTSAAAQRTAAELASAATASSSVGVAFQRSAYTLALLLWRYVSLLLSLLHTLRFIARNRYTGRLYEQRWVLLLQLALFWYLNPLYALVVVTDPLPSVLAFAHYRLPTLFLAVLVSFMFAVVTASMTWSRHDDHGDDEKKDKATRTNNDACRRSACGNNNDNNGDDSDSSSSSSDDSDDEKCCFCTSCWCCTGGRRRRHRCAQHDDDDANACASVRTARRALRRCVCERHGLYDPPCWTKLVAVAAIVVVIVFNVVDAAVANQSWLSPSNSGTFSVGYITLHALLAAAALVCMVLLFYLRYSLGKKPYLETRPQQLASRVFLFVFTGVVLYLALHAILFFVYYNALHPSLRTLQPYIQLPVLMVVTFAVNFMTLVYTNRGHGGGSDDDDDHGGVPVHARDARWRHMVWPDRWYRYLARHGGSQYIFLVERDETRFYQLQYDFRRRQLLARLKRAHASRELNELLVWSRSSRRQQQQLQEQVQEALAPPQRSGSAVPLSCVATPGDTQHHDDDDDEHRSDVTATAAHAAADASASSPPTSPPASSPRHAATRSSVGGHDTAGVSRALSQRMLNMDHFSTYFLPEPTSDVASPTTPAPPLPVVQLSTTTATSHEQQQQQQQEEHDDGCAVTAVAPVAVDVTTQLQQQQPQPSLSSSRFPPLLRRTLQSTRRQLGLLAEAAERQLVQRPVRTFDRLETHVVEAVYRPFQSAPYLPFFTLETAMDCLNLSWEVYYPPRGAGTSSTTSSNHSSGGNGAAATAAAAQATSGDEATAWLRVLDMPAATTPPPSLLRRGSSGSNTSDNNNNNAAAAATTTPSPQQPKTANTAAEVARYMNVEQYGYRLVHVAVAKNVQALIAVMDTTAPQHRGKAARVVVAFRGTVNMSNARHDLNLRRVTWHEMCDRDRAADDHHNNCHPTHHRCSGRDDSDSDSDDDMDIGGGCCCLGPLYCCCSGSSGGGCACGCEHTSCCAVCAHSRACRLRWRPTAHAGFVAIWRALSPQLLPRLQALLCGDRATVYRVFVTGHSMGGAVAALCAYSLSRLLSALRYPIPDVTVYTFGQPRFCNRAFQRRYNRAVPRTFDVQNEDDVVATMRVCGGCHVGVEVDVDRHGNYVVHPSVMERLFRPTTGRGLAVINHNLASYGNSFDALAVHSPCRARAFRPYATAHEQAAEHAREHHHHDHRANEAAAAAPHV